MRPALGQALEARAIQLDAAQVALAVIAGIGDEEERAAGFVRAFNVKHLKVALGDLIDQLGVGCQRIGFVE